MTWRPMKIKKIFIGRRPARETPRNQGGGRAKRTSCQGLNDVDGEKMGCPLKFGGLGVDGEAQIKAAGTASEGAATKGNKDKGMGAYNTENVQGAGGK